MTYIIFGGAGEQGMAIVRFLLNYTRDKIFVVDCRTPVEQHARLRCVRVLPDELPQSLHGGLGDCVAQFANEGRKSELEDYPIVINSISPSISLDIAYWCDVHRFHYLDLGGTTEITQTMNFCFSDHGQTFFIPDCGLAPGLISVITGWICQTMPAKYISILCGGLPMNRLEGYLCYVKSFSVKGLINECTGTVDEIICGKLRARPALYEVEEAYLDPVIYDAYEYEASPTSGSLSLTPHAFVGKLERLTYHTLRYPGHWKRVKEILSQPRAEEVLDRLIEPVGPYHPDHVILQIIAANEKEDVIFCKTWHWRYDFENNISAMAQSTGYTIAAIATMVSDGEVTKNGQKGGFLHLHDIDYPELERRIHLMPHQMIELDGKEVKQCQPKSSTTTKKSKG